MKIVCATSVALGGEAFSGLGDVVVVPEREITPAVVHDADLLITRSKVRIDGALLQGSRVSFVGTATAGTDHMDLSYLDDRGIAWTSAPGCNANSVGEYVIAALLRLAAQHALLLEGRTLAVVGVGHAGSRVAALARALGLRVLLNDPPRHAAEQLASLRPLEEILPQADFITFHVPLTDGGPYATRHLVDCRFLSALKPGCAFINAARGEVVDEDCLLLAIEKGWVSRAVLDVFENEPRLRRDVALRASLISPHIAGYSFEGRVRGTQMCYEAACRFLEREPAWDPAPILDEPRGTLHVDARVRSVADALEVVVRGAYDIGADDRALRASLDADDAVRGRNFQQLRASYRERFEFPAYEVNVEGGSVAVREALGTLGFRLASRVT